MNKIALISGSFAALALVAACAVDPVYIERRLPLPNPPQLPPVRMSIGQPLTIDNARVITIRDVLRQQYEDALKLIIKSTWSKHE